jgi:2-iminobutanoate/2-iminopropanoate deaminase
MSSRIKRIIQLGAVAPSGAYSQAVSAGDFLFVSGQGPIDPLSNTLVVGDISEQTTLTLQNISKILTGCGASISDIVKCSVFIESSDDFAPMDAAYRAFFGGTFPARTTVQAGMVESGMKVEIDCIAYLRPN